MLCGTLMVDSREAVLQDSPYFFKISRVQCTWDVETSKTRSFQHEFVRIESFVLICLPCYCVPFGSSLNGLPFKVHVEGLAKCLLDYSDYLGKSNKKMKEHHVTMVPSRQLATNLSISFLSVTDLRPSMFDSLNSHLSSIEEFQYVDVSEFSPHWCS